MTTSSPPGDQGVPPDAVPNRATTTGQPGAAGAWAPFGQPVFRVLWIATVVSNIGTWMHEVGAGWLMTALSPSPLMVALVQSATTLPIFLFALPAGAIADVMDRRRLLLMVQGAMALIAAALAVLVWRDAMTAPLLLGFTFLLGACAAFVAPVWQSIVPGLVPRPQLPAAIALNSLGINISRAIGPALAGLAIVALGLAAPFAFNAISFLGVILALWWWRPASSPPSRLPPEAWWQAIGSGLRFARHSHALRATLLRALAFFLPASAYWALLPLVARDTLGGDATTFGWLLDAVGVGAVVGALVLPAVRAKAGVNHLVIGASVMQLLVLVTVSAVPVEAVAIGASLLFGAGWIAVLSSLNVSAQTSLPDWVRARGLSLYLVVFAGSMSAGAALWGQVAALTSIALAMQLAALALLLGVAATYRVALNHGQTLRHDPANHWAAPEVALPADGERAPVMTMIEYRVADAHRDDFVGAITRLGMSRRRLGAYDWNLLEDSAQPGVFVEYFLEASWLQHLRHHAHVSEDEETLQQQIRGYVRDTPTVRHLLGSDAGGGYPRAGAARGNDAGAAR